MTSLSLSPGPREIKPWPSSQNVHQIYDLEIIIWQFAKALTLREPSGCFLEEMGLNWEEIRVEKVYT